MLTKLIGFLLVSFVFSFPNVANREHVLRRFEQLPRSSVDDDAAVWLRFALKHDDESINKLRDFVDIVSDPKHESYGEYMNVEQVRELCKTILHFVFLCFRRTSFQNS